MENRHDAIRHLKYLRQSLAQNNESIGFFLSAGCPLSVQMPEGEWPLIPDVAKLSEFVNETLKNDPNYVVLLEELDKAGKNKNNIEETLSFVRSLRDVAQGSDVRGLSATTLQALEDQICKTIVSKLDVELPTGETPYNRLCKWIKSIDRKVAIEIFTTNYDLLMEQAFEREAVPYFDGFVGSRKSFFDLRAVEDNQIPHHWSRLWKIHGSINWVQEVVGKNKQVHRSSEVRLEAAHLIYPSHLKYEESRKMPYLALMDQLNRFIRRKSSFLILCGYSFNDRHVNDTIVNALTANPTAMVLGLLFGEFESTGLGGDAVESYPDAYKLAKAQHNLHIWTFDKAIIGTTLGIWAKSPSEEEEDLDLSQFLTLEPPVDPKDHGRYFVRLGDFSELSIFSQKLIGRVRDAKDV